jgi:uncharacterized integral membrane protein
MLRALILTPFLLILVAFAISNPQPASLALWPTDVTLDAPLSIEVLVIAGVFFWLGALIVWFPSLAARRRARIAERRVAALEAELASRNKVPLLAAPR